MNRFRVVSHNFPFVEALLTDDKQGLAIRNYGMADKSDQSLCFSLQTYAEKQQFRQLEDGIQGFSGTAKLEKDGPQY